jgi:hypothetical protein
VWFPIADQLNVETLGTVIAEPVGIMARWGSRRCCDDLGAIRLIRTVKAVVDAVAAYETRNAETVRTAELTVAARMTLRVPGIDHRRAVLLVLSL